jgi:hypothetical protein
MAQREPQSEAATPAPQTTVQPRKNESTNVLAPGEPRLTQEWLNQWLAYTEWLLDIRLTDAQRRECQCFWVKHWQQTEQARKDRFWVNANAELEWFADIRSRSENVRNELRAPKQQFFVAALRQSSDPDERMLVAVHDAAHKVPASEAPPSP